MVITVLATGAGGATAPAGFAGAAAGAWAACCAITDVERSSRLVESAAALATRPSLTIDHNRVRRPSCRNSPDVLSPCQVDDGHVIAEAVGHVKVLVIRALGDVPRTASNQEVRLDFVGGN